MPIPAVVSSTDSFQTWLNATNNVISSIANTDLFIRVGTALNGNLAQNGTFTVSGLVVNSTAVITAGQMNVASNVAFTGANVVLSGTVLTISSNVSITGVNNLITGNLTINTGTLLVNAAINALSTMRVVGNTIILGTLTTNSTVILSGPKIVANSFIITGTIASNAASTDDWAPSGLSTAVVLRVDCTVDGVVITGLTIDDATRYRELYIFNVGSYAFTIDHNSSSSAANNRILNQNSADYVVLPNSGLQLWFDATSLRWRSKGSENGRVVLPVGADKWAT